MCNFKSEKEKADELAAHYSASFQAITEADYIPRYYENAFEHLAMPIITVGRPTQFQMFRWGLIPSWAKTEEEAFKIRKGTVNCKSEEMYDDHKPSFKESARDNLRCLIPCTGFYEFKHLNNGKTKIPHFIGLKNRKLYSIAGLYSRWKNPNTGQYIYTYTVLTTNANKLMEEIHNSGKRMPVIIPREYEKDWLNPNLSKDDVLALCRPVDDSVMQAYTIGKLVSNPKANRNVPEVMEPFQYPEELKLF
jgi:putative SOS response-associated peptidase YedK